MYVYPQYGAAVPNIDGSPYEDSDLSWNFSRMRMVVGSFPGFGIMATCGDNDNKP